jgi:ATP-dependent helicase/nuclease subunit A
MMGEIQQIANDRQRQAAEPEVNSWVSASAGTGKTKVLTDRILRLLLPKKKSPDLYIPGTPAHNILCLTFTKAAATEMKNRIQKRLADWVTMADDELSDELAELIGHAPDRNIRRAARQLFAAVIDAPGGMQIHTIHGFCQSVLRRFPLEANLPPQFEVMEESDADELLTRARHRALSDRHLADYPKLDDALSTLSAQINQDQFDDMLSALADDRQKIMNMLSHGLGEAKSAMAEQLGVEQDLTIDDLIQVYFNAWADRGKWNAALEVIYQKGGSRLKNTADCIQAALEHRPESKGDLDDYADGFLKADDTAYDAGWWGLKKMADHDPEIHDLLMGEAARLEALYERIKAVQIRDLTAAVMGLADGILSEYRALKKARAKLDYDDLIHKTIGLFNRQGLTSWVLYKLDGGIDHILIDEAQDTNPLQWDIVSAIADEFYAGLGRQGYQQAPRTVFVVGDEKQSIFSFQKADPAEFARMKDRLNTKCQRADMTFKDVRLDVSFRSTKAVLDTVDRVFDDLELADMATGPSQDNNIEHLVYRRGMAGSVECWPLIEYHGKTDIEPWRLPTTPVQNQDSEYLLANAIARTIDDWLKNDRQLESEGRAIRPGDILILIRSRTGNLIHYLIRALKDRNIPTSGVDRMKLSDQMIVRDLMALARFALMPSDDLMLANVLKSPLIGMTEDDLYDLAIDRDGDLWAALTKRSSDQEIYAKAHDYLRQILARVDQISPHAFFYDLLNQPCPADGISGRRALLRRLGLDARDPLDEFMAQCLRFEGADTPSMHGFLRWMNQSVGDIKREVDLKSSDEVRIMTVHGAKGLEAPIVFMPDTTRKPGGNGADNHKKLHWMDRTVGSKSIPIFLWSPRSEFDIPLIRERKDLAKKAERAEYIRLLYVAMTRARDHLIVAGREPRGKVTDTWYDYLSDAIADLGDEIDTPVGPGHRYRHDQTAPPKSGDEQMVGGGDTPLPHWMNQRLPDPDRSVRPYRPTAGDDQDQPVDSPMIDDMDYDPYIRGSVIHDLLEYLPNYSSDQWPELIDLYLGRYDEFDAEQSDQIREEIIDLLADPSLEPFFGPDSVAEAGITGLIQIDGQTRSLAGRIDRLSVIGDTVYILDYKTHRRPPDQMPTAYQKQLNGYKAAIRDVFTDHIIRCAVIWTAGPRLMWLDGDRPDTDHADDQQMALM